MEKHFCFFHLPLLWIQIRKYSTIFEFRNLKFYQTFLKVMWLDLENLVTANIVSSTNLILLLTFFLSKTIEILTRNIETYLLWLQWMAWQNSCTKKTFCTINCCLLLFLLWIISSNNWTNRPRLDKRWNQIKANKLTQNQCKITITRIECMKEPARKRGHTKSVRNDEKKKKGEKKTVKRDYTLCLCEELRTIIAFFVPV